MSKIDHNLLVLTGRHITSGDLATCTYLSICCMYSLSNLCSKSGSDVNSRPHPGGPSNETEQNNIDPINRSRSRKAEKYLMSWNMATESWPRDDDYVAACFHPSAGEVYIEALFPPLLQKKNKEKRNNRTNRQITRQTTRQERCQENSINFLHLKEVSQLLLLDLLWEAGRLRASR